MTPTLLMNVTATMASDRPSRAARPSSASRPPLALGLLTVIASVKLLGHLLVVFVTPYEVHRDEFLYWALGDHLQFWRMDVPPLIGVLADAASVAFGDTLFAVRVMPALAGTAVLVLAVLLAREFGGERRAQGLAGLAVLASPLFMRTATLFQPVVFDQLWWTLGLFTLVRLLHTEEHRWWLVLGLVTGLGLLTKLSILFFGLSVALALLLVPQRQVYLTRWPYLALLVALAVGSATFVGQVWLDWPLFGQMAALQAAQLDRVTPWAFVSEQFLYGPMVLLGWFGAGALLIDPRLRRFRVVGWTGVLAFVLLLVLQGKGYYYGPMYPALCAAGAMALGHLGTVRRVRMARWACVSLLVAYGVVALPVGLPVLPPEPMAQYAQRFGLTAALKTNWGATLPLPQDYADMLGWEEMVQTLADAYHAMPPEEQQATVIAGENYGEAGAIDFYGPRYGLPRAIGAHTSYWFFGPGDKPGDVLLTLGVSRKDLLQFYEQVEEVGRHTHPWAVQQDVPIYKATGPKQTLQELWPSLAGRY